MALLALESVALVVLVIWLVVLQTQAAASDAASGIALLIIGVLCAVWVIATTLGAARRRSWMRASSVTWHLIVFAVAVGSFLGATAVPTAGWWLLLVSIVGIALVFAPQVTRATAREVAPASEDQAAGPKA